jgi:hypothetical protein
MSSTSSGRRSAMLDRELRQVLAELELVSHVPAVNMDSSSRDAGEDIGGKRPPGGIHRQDDREDSDNPERSHHHKQKSAEHFKRRLARARGNHQRRQILTEAREALKAWKVQPPPPKDLEPERSSSQWKRYVAESSESHQTLADRFGVSRQYIAEVRRKYRPAA